LASSEDGQTVIRELCDALVETFNTLTQMTDRTNSDDLRPTPLPSDKKSLEFTRAVLKHSFTPSKLTDLVKCLRETRSDVQMCLTKLETTFQHVQTLYYIMSNGLTRTTSRASIFSTSTNLTVRIELAAWLKRWEEAWGNSIQRKPTTSVSHALSCQMPFSSYIQLPLRDFLQSRDMIVAGISHMTDDLLGKIFYHVCDPGPLSLRHLLFVSRRFYSAAVNSAHLWTTISFDPLFCRHFRQSPEQGNIFVEQCLLRSGPLPLCLYFDHSDPIAHDLFTHPLETFGKPEWRGVQRCTSMVWVKSDLLNPKIVALLPKSLPSLQYISLSRLIDPIDGSQFPICPVLERVELLSHGRPSPPFWGTNFLHVTTLSFGNNPGWTDYDMTTLSQFPVLHDLTLFTKSEPGGLFGDTPKLAVNFKCLQILRAHGYVPPEILSKLVAPALEELHIKGNITSIDSLQKSFEPHCQHLYALLPMAVSAKDPEWATNLSRLVQKCTRINSLYISKWMKKECKKFISRRNGVILHVQ
jgi:hypothetical protein